MSVTWLEEPEEHDYPAAAAYFPCWPRRTR
jgi:hypothetical protein